MTRSKTEISYLYLLEIGQSALTIEKCIQAFVWHVLIDQQLFFSFNTATKKSYKIPMLQFRNHLNLIHKFFEPLPRCSWESFHCYFLSIWQFSLDNHIIFYQAVQFYSITIKTLLEEQHYLVHWTETTLAKLIWKIKTVCCSCQTL